VNTDEENLKKLNSSLQEQLKLLRQNLQQYRTLTDGIAEIMGDNARPLPITQACNIAFKYIPMGIHFETLMKAINSTESLTNEWENLMILLRLAGADGSGDDD
jgi:hypothetical protein